MSGHVAAGAGAAATSAVDRAVARAHTEEWAVVLAATARVAADLDLAEDCVQDAYAQALVHWRADGVPRRPGAWLTTVATRRVLEHRRRAATLARKLPQLVVDALPADEADETGTSGDDPTAEGWPALPDDRLRLVFTCCHPALGREAQVALTLRLVCGLSSAEIARAFLVKEATVQARITRAKRKIAEARIPYRVPVAAELPERLDAVLETVHLVYTAGHAAPFGHELLRSDLAHRGVALARMLHRLVPDHGEVTGLLGLLLLTEARSAARTDAEGQLLVMSEQDRRRWDADLVAEGLALVREAVDRPPVGRFAVMAAAAAVHAEARSWEETDWAQLLGLYDLLLARWPTPVVALNRAVALSYAESPQAALAAVESLAREPALATYPYLAATRADLLRRCGDRAAAVTAYDEAVAMAGNDVETGYLQRRLEEVRGATG